MKLQDAGSYSSKSRHQINRQEVSACALGLVGVVIICLCIILWRPNQFAMDDAINEYLPYWNEIARLYRTGEVPILSSQSFSGGNFLVDFQRSIFHPITLVFVIITYLTSDPLIQANIFAVSAMSLFFLSSYSLFRVLSAKRWPSVLGAMTITFSPLILTMYMPAWWNAMEGMISFSFAAASSVLFLRHRNFKTLTLVFLATICLFLAGWPHSYVALAVFLLILALTSYRLPYSQSASWRPILALAVTVTLAGLTALPSISEFIHLQPYLARESSINNVGNNGVPPLDQVLPGASPVTGTFWMLFGSYTWQAVPLGFLSLIVLLFLLRKPNSQRLLADPVLLTCITIALVFACMTQMPFRVGPIKEPFRFLPYAQIFLVASGLILWQKTHWKWSLRRFGCVVGIAVLIAMYSWSRIEHPLDDWKHSTLLPMAFVITIALVSLLTRFSLPRRVVPPLATLMGTVLLVLQQPASQWVVPDTTTPTSLSSKQLQSGFTLHTSSSGALENGVFPGMWSARYLLAGIPLVNGYDPVGQANYFEHMSPMMSQGIVNNSALDYLSESVPGTSACKFAALRIVNVFTDDQITEPQMTALEHCDFKLTSSIDGTLYFTHDSSDQTPRSTITTVGADADFTVSGTAENLGRSETFHARNNSDAPKFVYLARMYWPGYRAEGVDGGWLQVSSLDGFILRVEIPPNFDDEVNLDYSPETWRWALPVSGGAGGLFVIGAIASVVLRKNAKRREQLQPSSR